MDEIIITGHHYTTNHNTMITIITVLSILLAAVVFVAIRESNKAKVDKIDENLDQPEKAKCGCGLSNDSEGYCDGSHNNPSSPASGSVEYSR